MSDASPSEALLPKLSEEVVVVLDAQSAPNEVCGVCGASNLVVS
jgi:hypothetical protein